MVVAVADQRPADPLHAGQRVEDNWTALFKPGERIRLRLINASAMNFFDVSIPGLDLTVVQADGQNVRPVKPEKWSGKSVDGVVGGIMALRGVLDNRNLPYVYND